MITKKRKKVIIICSLLLATVMFPQVARNYKAEKKIKQEVNCRVYTMKDKHDLFEKLGRELKSYGLKISAKAFADACMIALYCESNLKTNSVGNAGSQGINQLTADTRRRLEIPTDILQDDFLVQLGYFKKYLIASGKVHLIRDAISLHALNFSPSNPTADTFCVARNSLTALDLNKNGHIDRDDFAKFQRKRVKESQYVKNIYQKRYGVEEKLSPP